MTEDSATGLSKLNGLDLYPPSTVVVSDVEVGLATTGTGPRLAVLAPSGSQVIRGFEGEITARGDRKLVICPAGDANLDALRDLLPWLRPSPLGIRGSVGFGDRLGLATPGHVRALRCA
ncbi:MAG TPA: tagaturonate epimerase family protein, partial [Rubrobacter sp.]|nr:tagaturonate epimerase family protein [Rubrobacter sp.]